MSVIDDLSKRDPFGGVCIPEDDLDAAFMLGKGEPVPRTCLPEDVPATIDILTEALGRAPTTGEWDTFKFRHFHLNNPNGGYLKDTPPPIEMLSPVPLDGSLGYAMAALVAFALVALIKSASRRSVAP